MTAYDPGTVQAVADYIVSQMPLDEYVRNYYPQLSWALAIPELKNLLTQAAHEKWDSARLQGALQNTTWWKTTNAAQREWQRLLAEDPASAHTKLASAQMSAATLAQRLGVTLPAGAAATIAQGIASEGWDQQRMTQEVMKYATGSTGSGDIQGIMMQVKQRATAYMIPLSDQAATTWAKNILTGAASMDGLNGYLIGLAKARFAGSPSVLSALDQGFTVKDVFDPYVQQIANLLEVSPDQVNLMDSKWSKVIDGTGGRPLTLSETADYVRSLPEWRTTKQANEKSAGFGETLLKTFGQVA